MFRNFRQFYKCVFSAEVTENTSPIESLAAVNNSVGKFCDVDNLQVLCSIYWITEIVDDVCYSPIGAVFVDSPKIDGKFYLRKPFQLKRVLNFSAVHYPEAVSIDVASVSETIIDLVTPDDAADSSKTSAEEVKVMDSVPIQNQPLSNRMTNPETSI